MANYLILNKPQVFNGLGTLSYVVTTTGQYNVSMSITVPEAMPVGDGAGSGTGLGSGQATQTSEDFSDGDLGAGYGGTGLGFTKQVDYPQPSAQGSNETLGSAVSSGVSVLVKDNGSTIFTAPTIQFQQSAMQFKYGFQATAGHTITVVLASSTASDNGLNGVESIISIGEGLL